MVPVCLVAPCGLQWSSALLSSERKCSGGDYLHLQPERLRSSSDSVVVCEVVQPRHS